MKYIALLVLSFFNLPILASGNTNINWWGLGSDYADAPALGWLSLTFILFAIALIKFIKKPLSNYLAIRSEEIQKIIKENADEKTKNEELFKTYQDKIKSISLEIEKIKKEYQEIAHKEQEEIINKAQAMADKMRLDMQASIQASLEKTKNALTCEIVEEALNKACFAINKNQKEFDEIFKKDFMNKIDKAKEII